MAKHPIGLDFETKCDLDIRDVGLYRYVEHPSFRVLLASVAFDEGTDHTYDFTESTALAKEALIKTLEEAAAIYVFNAEFERAVLKRLGIPNAEFERAVFKRLGIPNALLPIRDAAITARSLGAANSLDHVAQQLLGEHKLSAGASLIKKFCGPEPLPPGHKFDNDWTLFKLYCERDARLALRIGLTRPYFTQEYSNELITHHMNMVGWPVDIAAAKEMYRRYQANSAKALEDFRAGYDPKGELNFASPIQLLRWCHARKVNVKSMDEEHVNLYYQQVAKKLESTTLTDEQRENYTAVFALLTTKKIMGGSSLKKLPVLLRTVSDDNRLRGQYMHIGASQSFRTTGRGVQMQNLKRLKNSRPMEELFDPEQEWTNEELASNFRKLFTSSHPQGELIVADYSSIEARALAFLAGQEDVLDAFRQGLDLYKVQAAKKFEVPYDQVTDDQRTFGKVGVLSCGYQAGPRAVQTFASKMNMQLTLDQAEDVVYGWRDANPMVVDMWERLDAALRKLVNAPGVGPVHVQLAQGYYIELDVIRTPDTLQQQHPGAQSISMVLADIGGDIILERIFNGLYIRGNTICYFKADVKNGKLWSDYYFEPKTKEEMFYTLYGGKLTGILVQSFCREIFFNGLVRLMEEIERRKTGLELIGQFHDEVIVDWTPSGDPDALNLEEARDLVATAMTIEAPDNFPLGIDVKSDYRYIK